MLSKFKKILFLLIALACFGIGGTMMLTEEVPVFIVPLTDGHIITEADLSSKRLFINNIPSNIIKSRDYLIGKSISGGVPADTLIPTYSINADSGVDNNGAVQSSSNLVTVSLIVSYENVPKDLHIGDKISIVAQFSRDEETFNILFPTEGMVQAIKTDAEGNVNGLDVNVNFDSVVDLLYSSQNATLQIIKLNGSANKTSDSTDATKIYQEYFYHTQQAQPEQTGKE